MNGWMTRRSRWAILAVLVLGACTSGAPASQSATSQPTGPAQGSGSQPTTTDATAFTVAFTGFGFSDAPMVQAIDDLNASGYEIETTEVADPNLMIAGTAEGQFHFSSGDTAALLRAISEGAKLRIIGERVGDEWTLGTVVDITSCAEMEGRTVAYHAVGSFNEVIVRAYIQENCPGTMPEEVIIEGSENRAAAMLAGRLDSSPLELSDAVNVIDKGGDGFRILTSFNETLPNLRPATLAVNTDFMAENPTTTKAFLGALIEVNRRIVDDPDYLKEIALEHAPSIDEATLDEVVQQYVEFGLFDPNGGTTEENLEYTIEFFTNAGSIPAGLTLDQAADLSHLNEVLEEIGRR